MIGKILLLYSALVLSCKAADCCDANAIVIMGSSVANGEGADRDSCGKLRGYARQYDELLSSRYDSGLSSNPFHIVNLSVNGNNSVDLLNRYDDLKAQPGRWVVFGISLGNEGIHGASDRDSVFCQFKTNMLELIAMARRDGKQPVVMNNYTRTDFDAADYESIKRMNEEIAFWDVPSVNLLGAIDDGQGRWASDCRIEEDIYHPNQRGHTEFFHAMVPSMFDAMSQGKPLEMYRDTVSRFYLPPGATVGFAPDDEVHSFTLALRGTFGKDGRIASISPADGAQPLTLTVAGGKVTLAGSGIRLVNETMLDEGMNEIVLSQNYARRYVTLTVNGHTVDQSEISPTTAAYVEIGDDAGAYGATLGELMFYRSSMHTSSPFTPDGRLNKSSLEVYSPLGVQLVNKAMSTVTLQLHQHEKPE